MREVDFSRLARPPWTWACLSCNATGTGPADAHRCAAGDHHWRREFWRARLLWAEPRLAIGEINALLAAPIARAELVRLLGERWRAEMTSPAQTVSAGANMEAV